MGRRCGDRKRTDGPERQRTFRRLQDRRVWGVGVIDGLFPESRSCRSSSRLSGRFGTRIRTLRKRDGNTRKSFGTSMQHFIAAKVAAVAETAAAPTVATNKA